MQYRVLGKSGLQVSELSLGTMNFGMPTSEEEAFSIMDSALEGGINLFDTADVYNQGESERILGKWLLSRKKREEIILSSKVGQQFGKGANSKGTSLYRIVRSCEESLSRLKTDRIDIYFLHRTDLSVRAEETLKALDLLRSQGKILYAACSTHPPWRTTEALFIADRLGYPRFICEQAPYNLLDRRAENEIIPMCRHFGLGLLTWSPLAQGMLAGRYSGTAELPSGSRGTLKPAFTERITREGIEVSNRLGVYLQNININLPQFALAWILKEPAVSSVLLGPRTKEQLLSLLPAGNLSLPEETVKYCDELVTPGNFVSNHFNTSGWM